MKCSQERLYDYIENELEGDNLKMIEEHIKDCKKCTDILTTFNLMKTIGESNIHAPQDLSDKIMNEIDENIYENKKYFFINKIIENKRNIMRYAWVSILALVIISAPFLNKKFNFVGNVKNDDLVKVDKEIENLTKYHIDESPEEFLLKCGYHISEKLSEEEVTLTEKFQFNLQVDASKEIGLDLEKYKNKEVKQISYALKEKSQYNFNGDINANLIYNDKSELSGAFLTYDGYYPSIVPLNDRSNIKPESFEPDTFKFTDVDKVEVLGPGGMNGESVWKERRTINSNDLEKFISVLETSKPLNEELKDKVTVENEYMICINYKDGAQLRLYYHKDIDKIDIIGLPDWYFETNDELERLIVNF